STAGAGGGAGADLAGASFDAFLAANPITSSFQGGIQALSQATAYIKDLETQIETALGIGRGRREADLITPYEYQLGGPGGILNTAQLLAADPAHDNATDLNEIYQLCNQAVQTFYKYIDAPGFTNKTRWPDGRAGKACYANMQPIAAGILAAIKAQLIAAGGYLVPLANISSGGSIGDQLGNKLLQWDAVGDGGASGAFRNIAGNSGIVIIGAVVLVALLVMRK